jgi:hypothetical protein
MTSASLGARHDTRRRNLMILGGITALFVALAVIAVLQQASSLAPTFEPRPFFPDLAEHVNDLGEITITTKAGAFHVRLNQGKWVVVEKDGFPADASQVRSVGVGVAVLTTLEPKTNRPDWLNYVGLGAPDKGGDGIEVKLTDTKSQPMADVLVGKTQGNADELGRTALYVRKPNENQTWLARGNLAPRPNAADWLDKNVIAIARDRVKGASVSPATGPAYTLSRDTKDQQDFKLLDMPAGRALSFEGSPDGVGSALIGFDFDDVAKTDQFDFTKAPQSVTHTFDGLDVTVKIATKGMDHWASITAAGTNPMTQNEATAINARLAGWAFKLQQSKVDQFLATRETLLKPPGSPATPAAAPGRLPQGLPPGLPPGFPGR